MNASLTYSILASLFTWSVTALGASLVFVFKDIKQSTLSSLYASASGVMMASSCFGLIVPALESTHESMGRLNWIPVALGMLISYLIFTKLDSLLHKAIHKGNGEDEVVSLIKSIEKNKTGGKGGNKILSKGKNNLSKIILMLSAITLHNFPEGLAVGIAFGASNSCSLNADDVCVKKHFNNAVSLTLGIALQNFPEGIAVAFPLRQCGMGIFKSFWYGQLSAIVEPVGAILGALLTLKMQELLPYFLGFAAGAMIYVTVSEMIPECFSKRETKNQNNLFFLFGFLLMMVLEGVLE